MESAASVHSEEEKKEEYITGYSPRQTTPYNMSIADEFSDDEHDERPNQPQSSIQAPSLLFEQVKIAKVPHSAQDGESALSSLPIAKGLFDGSESGSGSRSKRSGSDYPPDLEAPADSAQAEWDQLDQHLVRLRQICSDPKFLDHEFSFDCINQVYFIEQIEKMEGQLSPEEAQNLHNSKHQLQTKNKVLFLQFEVFQACLAILNILIDKWNLLDEAEINFDHKKDDSINVIKILDVDEVKRCTISLDILWMTCENSPLRYMYAELIDYIPEVQLELMSLMNVLVNIAIKPNTNYTSFI